MQLVEYGTLEIWPIMPKNLGPDTDIESWSFFKGLGLINELRISSLEYSH